MSKKFTRYEFLCHLITVSATGGFPSVRAADCNKGPNCLYRSGDKKCVFGHGIPDEFYCPAMDGAGDGTVTLDRILKFVGSDMLVDLTFSEWTDIRTAHDELANMTNCGGDGYKWDHDKFVRDIVKVLCPQKD